MAHAGIRKPGRQLSDDRFGLLATLLGLADADHARGKYERLIDVCTMTQHYTVSELAVFAVFGARGVDALVRAQLGMRVLVHQPTPLGAELGIAPTPAGRDELVVRLEYTEKYIEWYGRVLKGASRGGHETARRAREAVDKAVNSLSETCWGDEVAARGLSTDGVPQGTPQGTAQGAPLGQPSDARASEIPERSQIPDHQKAKRAPSGLRVLEGGAEGSGS